ncbi:MAG: glycosyltransferase [Flavobacteriales bacterium]|nr:glycosyltransferase [Flavobacteriales bacterium]
MRVCLVSSSFYPAIFYGGPISSTWDLSKKLGEKNIEVYVSTTNADGNKRIKDIDTKEHIKQAENVFVRYYHEQLINIFSFSFLFGVFSDIKKSDVVYIQYLFHYTVLFSLLFSVFLGKKIILCPRGSFSSFTLSNKRSWLKRLWLFLFISPLKNKIIWQASSYLEKEDILFYFPKVDVKIIPDGIDVDSFSNSNKMDKKELLKKYTNKDFKNVSDVVFSMGRLHKIKRFDILINAFELYLDENKNAKLLIAGADDGVRNALENQIKELKLEDSVFMIGLVNFSQKKELLSNCSFFSLSSDFESFGIVVSEALACGVPVVVSDKTSWKNIERNNCGIFVKNQKEDFCTAFHQIKERNFTSENCRRYVKDNFDWGIITKKFLTILTNN